MPQPSLIKHIRDIIILPFTVTAIIPYLLYNAKQPPVFANIVAKIIGTLIFAAGLTLFFYTVYLFKTFGKGTLAPWAPPEKLIILGPYKYCRNPMITGVLFILTGETLYLHSINILLWTGAVFLINTFYFILIEEPGLSRRFGDQYNRYKEHVPRWVPGVRPYLEKQTGSTLPK